MLVGPPSWATLWPAIDAGVLDPVMSAPLLLAGVLSQPALRGLVAQCRKWTEDPAGPPSFSDLSRCWQRLLEFLHELSSGLVVRANPSAGAE